MNIDTTKAPSIPRSLKGIESHDTSMGTIEWDKSNVELHLEPEQEDGYIEGNKLRKKLEGTPVLNATALDWLMENQDQIPDSWKGKYVYFWGTIYRGSGGGLCVRCAYFLDGRWMADYDWLDNGWGAGSPAARLASISTKSSEPQPLSSDTLSLVGVPLTMATSAKKGEQVEVRDGKVYKVEVCKECGRVK